MDQMLTPALRAVMGDRIYFVAALRLSDVASRINFAHEVHPNDALNELIQRRLSAERAEKIADYLLREEQRFFNALVVGVYGGDPCWYDFKEISPVQPAGHLKLPPDSENMMGFLSLTGSENLFALDGQHRLAGIKRALLHDKDLGQEQVAVIFVSHHAGSAGLQRTRRLFTVLNKTAKPVLKGDIVALDEDDTMAICTRRLVNTCEYFSRNQVAMRVLNSLPPTDKTSWTTITTTYDMLSTLFHTAYPRCTTGPASTREQLRNARPSDDVLDNYYNFAVSYFELLAQYFPDVRQVLKGKVPARAVRKHRHEDGGSILYRPLGQNIVTQVVSILTRKRSLHDAVKLIGRIPTALNEPPFANVIWDLGKRTMINNGTAASLAKDLILYMLKEETRLKPDTLRLRYAGFLGKPVERVRLPSPVV